MVRVKFLNVLGNYSQWELGKAPSTVSRRLRRALGLEAAGGEANTVRPWAVVAFRGVRC